MRYLFVLSALSLSFFATTAQAQRRTAPARKPVAAQTPAEMPHKLDLPGLNIGADNLLLDLGVLDAVKGKTVALRSLTGGKGFAMVFISNTCAEVQNQKKALINFVQQAKEAGLEVVYVNSNQRGTEEIESPPAMREFALKEGIKEPYLFDQNMQMADIFGVQRLPEVFIFNGSGHLAYRGAIETAPYAGKEAICFACDALQNLSDISRISYPMTAGKGCAILPQE